MLVAWMFGQIDGITSSGIVIKNTPSPFAVPPGKWYQAFQSYGIPAQLR